MKELSPFAGMDAASLLVLRAGERGQHPLLVWVPFDGPEEVWSYARVVDAAARVASGLRARGVRPGDRVLVHLENCPETLIARLACAWLGAVAVVSNAIASGPEIGAMIGTTMPRGAITQPRAAGLIAEHARSVVEWIAVTATDAGEAPAARDIPERAERFEALLVEPLPQRPPDPSAPALILFTTGTTAGPKAVLWTHENLLWAACLGARQQGFRAEDVAQIFLPLFHVVGFSWSFLPVLWAGATAVLQPRFSASRFWPVALRHGTTVCAHVPFTLGALDARPRPAEHGFRFWITNRQLPEAQERFGVPRIVSAWGMTEMVSQPIVGCSAEASLTAEAMGRPSLGYEIRIAAEEGHGVAPGGTGELLVGGQRGRSIFREYFRAPEATAEAFDADGFFRTGDRVCLLENGSIRFVERTKDVIKVGGEGVSASEIEAVIRGVGGVRDVAVVPRPDSLRGEVPVAFVVLEASEDTAEEVMTNTILNRCRAEMARFKVPGEIRYIDTVPRVGFGKVAKGRLREMAAGDAS